MLKSKLNHNLDHPTSSTGPKTAAGKARSSQNSLVHGMYANTALLPSEYREEYLQFTTAMKADLKPIGPLQTEIAQIISDNYWRLRRFRALETNEWERLADVHTRKDADDKEVAWSKAMAWSTDCSLHGALERLGKHEQRITNQTGKALIQLKELQREASQPAQTETVRPTKSGFVPQHPVTTAAPTPPTTAPLPAKPPHPGKIPAEKPLTNAA